MPMLLMMALAAQTVTLSADTREAAITCGAAYVASAPERNTTQTVMVAYFAMAAARVDATADQFMDKTIAGMEPMAARVPSIGKNVDALLAECHKRFPAAWATKPVTLPRDDYERRLMCVSTAGTLSGIVGASTPEGLRLSRRFGPLVTDAEMTARGVKGADAYGAEVARALAVSIDLGTLQAIARSCEAAFPA